MVELSRRDVPSRNAEYPGAGTDDPHRLLPEEGTPLPGMPTGSNLPSGFYGNRRLTRSAERIGRGLGSAVSTARRLPNRFDTAGSRLRVVGGRTRANASAAAFDLMDNAAQRASTLRDAATEHVSRLSENVGERLSDLTDRASRNWREIQQIAVRRLEAARDTTQRRVAETRRAIREWQNDDPLKVLATVAATAFVAGVALRIWRSNRD